ncbi:hypothetical protein EVAR_74412_1 [Eumeta japonica]|uniref:Uncharacterized protein n=1 Tax=Eumeta variegata TaxID=151549 RepID=A0A4C1SDH0_EUMVA|nr:hypothetical protein EVAR_74412_1 [Eumeta japonica]
MLTGEFQEGPSKSVVVPQNIDAVRQLTMQDCHVTYREIEASLGIIPVEIGNPTWGPREADLTRIASSSRGDRKRGELRLYFDAQHGARVARAKSPKVGGTEKLGNSELGNLVTGKKPTG